MKSVLISTLVLVFLVTAAFRFASPGKEELIGTEKKFSDLCMKSGMKVAFLEFMDSTAVLLRAGHPPIVGKAAAEFVGRAGIGPGVLSWVPAAADLAASGELGYTYGIYTVHNSSGDQTGTYTTVWKKNGKGEWKFVLDTGNPGTEGEKK
jgi:ketosteroid isomerase-like protein